MPTPPEASDPCNINLCLLISHMFTVVQQTLWYQAGCQAGVGAEVPVHPGGGDN